MAEIINLNHWRKEKAKTEKEKKAAANRAAHGRTKVEKQNARKAEDRAKSVLDGKKLDDDSGQS